MLGTVVCESSALRRSDVLFCSDPVPLPWARHLRARFLRPLDLGASDVFPASKFYLGRHSLQPMIKSSLCYTISLCWQRRNRCPLETVFCALMTALLVRSLRSDSVGWLCRNASRRCHFRKITTGRRRWGAAFA